MTKDDAVWLERCLHEAGEYFQITSQEVLSGRKHYHVRVRIIICYAAYTNGISFQDLAIYFSKDVSRIRAMKERMEEIICHPAMDIPLSNASTALLKKFNEIVL